MRSLDFKKSKMTNLWIPFAVCLSFYLGVLWESHQKAVNTMLEHPQVAKQTLREEFMNRPVMKNPSARDWITEHASLPRTVRDQLLASRRQKLSTPDRGVPFQITSLEQEATKRRAGKRLPKLHQQGARHTNETEVFDPDPQDGRPPFESLFDEEGELIPEQTDKVLDFAVIGFGKCGTTTMIGWLDKHPQLQTFSREIYDMALGRMPKFLQKMYSITPRVGTLKGYKSPNDLHHLPAVNNLATNFPTTKLLVGIRHPVHWFESLYNFRIQNVQPHLLDEFPHPEELVGRCTRKRKNTCTHKGEFALSLRNLGKTLHRNEYNLEDGTYDLTPFEERMYEPSYHDKELPEIVKAVPNPVFLFEISQMKETPEQLTRDIQEYLNLTQPFPSDLPHYTPGRVWATQAIQDAKDARKIDICKHPTVRKELMRMARVSSYWIRNYFVTSPGVFVSNRSHFNGMMERWMMDPCGEKDTAQAGSYALELADTEEMR